ncbi:copper resistance system multicopper oxidase [Ralstonia solanacearum]|uniref:copper resistance system multicopper oxidase n=1 Tax=Ralstonia solanacearum TaxID=305 RepID=UPI000ACC6327|nr:copper resistance system multicopper oxidase [Ralstonia solanacearum]MDC6177089.1 copper resistance system multicopper oxidase [Ralstonia solanacearum]MDC6238379.1 copper resistance system multicopper oxidase [Ralstonia solanacearum]
MNTDLSKSGFLLPMVSSPLSRRRFLQGIAATAAMGGLGLGFRPGPAWASPAGGTPTELSGTEFDLVLAPMQVNFTGRPAMATVINGQLPGPVLRVREGDTVTLRVTNRLSEPTAVHWHGVILDPSMDGVPGISFAGIAPGETFTYRIKVRQSGTYWYHAHTLHEQTGFYGAMIAEPRAKDPIQADRDYTVMLSDWTDENPLEVYTNLKKMGGYYNFGQPTVGDFFTDVHRLGLAKAMEKRSMWNQSRMSPTDFSDVSGVTYTYLINGATPTGNWTAIAQPGERVRLRFIGAGTGTFFDVRIPGLKLMVVATDGQQVEPVEVDEFRISPGETYDVIVRMPDDRAYTIFAQSMDRTGYARGTLAPRAGMQAAVPAVDAPVWLEASDMMGAMAGMEDMPGMDMGPAAPHARTEYGPNVDMRVDYPRTNLDDPGVGLRNNGRRVLTYADLRTVGGSLDARAPGRTIEMHLTGNMDRFIWSIDGLKLSDAKPMHFRPGERLRVVMHNDTMMAHPMHLHGMWSEMETPDGAFQARKHTITVQPAQRVSFAVTADPPGRWAFHCHLLYHMAAGMFREVVVA